MSDNKVSQNRVKKEGIVAKLLDKKAKAKALVFTNYQGLTHKQIEELKKGIKAADAEFVVAKNSLLHKAMPDIKEIEGLVGPTGTIFAYTDVVAPLKEVAKAIKQFTLPTIKFGILEGEVLTGDQVLKISSLPTRDVLIAQLVGGLKSPIFGFHRALNWNLQKLVMTLSEVQKKRSAEAPIAQVTEPVQAENPIEQKSEEQPASTGVADEQKGSEEVKV